MPVGTAQSLITRCPACGTAFRASGRQLEARGGQVRCGRCGRVFDGLAHSIELPGSSVEPPSPAVPEIEPLYDSTSFMAERLEGEEAQKVVSSSPPPQGEVEPAEVAHFASPGGEVGAEEPAAAEPELSLPELSPPEAIEVEPLKPEEPPLPEIAGPEAAHEPAPHEPLPPVDIDLVAAPQAAGEEHPAVEAASGAEQVEPAFGVDEPPVPDGVAHKELEPTEPAPEPWPAFTHEASAQQEKPLQAESPPEEARHEEPPREEWAEETARQEPEAAEPENHAPPSEAAPVAVTRPARSLRADEPPLDFGRRKPARSRVAVWESAIAAVLLLLALGGQIVYSQRANLLVLFPAARPAAEKLCAGLHCDLPYPRRADLMSIESSNLQADTANPAVMVLTATLRNRAPFPQAQPALELTLTDGQDQALARRVLGPADYGAPQSRFFPAASEQPVKLYFDATAVKATGYRLYLFYP